MSFPLFWRKHTDLMTLVRLWVDILQPFRQRSTVHNYSRKFIKKWRDSRMKFIVIAKWGVGVKDITVMESISASTMGYLVPLQINWAWFPCRLNEILISNLGGWVLWVRSPPKKTGGVCVICRQTPPTLFRHPVQMFDISTNNNSECFRHVCVCVCGRESCHFWVCFVILWL